MNKLKRIEAIEKELRKLKAEIGTESKGVSRFEFKEDETYFYIVAGEIKDCNYDNDELDKNDVATGNAFKTKEQAETRLMQLQVEQQMRVIAERLNDGKEIDWSDESQDKHFIKYHEFRDGFAFLQELNNKYKTMDIYCLSIGFYDSCISEIGEQELIKYYKSL